MAKKLFTNAKTEAGLNAAVNAGALDAHVAFIEETGNEGIHANGKTYHTIPSNGKDGQVLISLNGKGVWTDPNSDVDLLDVLTYGVEWDPDIADPELTRVGNMSYHKTLPIQSGMKGCIFNPKTKEVVYWLDESNWKYKKGGNPDKGEPEELARLDGYDGEVMVYVPEFWIRSWRTNKRAVRISPTKIDDTWEHQPADFIAAYPDTLFKGSTATDLGYLGTLEKNSAVSVANRETYCRGGGGHTSFDADSDIFKGTLGKCITNYTRADFRKCARRAGKEIMSYKEYKNIMYWLYVIEYANFNVQAPFNPELTTEGFHQGGLGAGLTNVTNWNSYNYENPITPNGYTNDIGNGTGIKLIEPLGPSPRGNVFATRWRGFENPFGDASQCVDGIIINASSVNSNTAPLSEVYATDNPELYGETNYTVMAKIGEEDNTGESAYIKEWYLGTTAEIIPSKDGGDATQFKCDRHSKVAGTGLRILYVGGNASQGSYAGLGHFNSGNNQYAKGYGYGFRTSCLANT